MTKIEITKNTLLSSQTFYGIGGPADELWKIHSPEGLEEIWAETLSLKIPKMILGKGSNTIFSDAGFRGRIFQPLFNRVQKISGNIWTVDVGKNWQEFVEEVAKAGFSDLENMSGIPGNIGGFIRGNAGAFGSETKDFILSVEYIDKTGTVQKIPGKKCQWDYRSSIFKKNPDWFILRATFEFKKAGKSQEILDRTKAKVAERWQKYPPGRSGGSFFKNPEGDFAGRLLEEAGAKGDSVGGVEISQKHANFFVNKKNATQKDILALARKWKQIVQEKHGIELIPEIFICDEYGRRIDL